METNFLFAYHDGILVIKLVGSIRYTSGSRFNEFIERVFAEREFTNILVDLSETTAIDSTNLGLLAKIAKLRLAESAARPTIVSPVKEITEILTGIGLDRVYLVIEKPGDDHGELSEMAQAPEADREMMHTMLEAHKELMGLSEQNAAVFKSVVDALEGELGEE